MRPKIKQFPLFFLAVFQQDAETPTAKADHTGSLVVRFTYITVEIAPTVIDGQICLLLQHTCVLHIPFRLDKLTENQVVKNGGK